MFKKSCFTALWLSLTAGSHAVLADDERIENLLVSATRFEGPTMPLATNITVIDASQISAMGVTSLTDVLKSQAGIQVRQLGGSGDRNSTVSMRGFGENASNNILFLVDGRKLNNPTLGVPALNSVALQDILRIEIVQGSAGVLYGDQAVAGVINVITKKPESGEAKGMIAYTGGDDGLEKYRGSISQGFDNGMSYRFSGEKRQADNYRDNTDNDYENYLAQLRYRFAKGQVFIEGQNINDNLRVAGAITEAEAKVDHRATNKPNDYSNLDTEIVRLGGDIEVVNNWTFALEYAWRDENAKVFWDDYATGLYPTLAKQHTRVKNWSPRLIGKLNDDGSAIVTLGYDLTQSDYLVREWFTDAEQEVEAYYAQLIFPVGDRVTVNIGGRTSDFTEENHSASVKQSDTAEAYEAGVNVKVSDSLNVFARFAQAFRFATLDENGFTLAAVDFLKPQTNDSVELGFQYDLSQGYSKVTFFDMNIHDEIAYDAEVPNPSWWNPANLGANINLPDSERRGVIIELGLDVLQNINLGANYTFTDAEQKSGSFDGKDVPFVAAHMANVFAEYRLSPTIKFYGDVQYTGSRYRSGDNNNVRGKVSSYTITNFSVSYGYRSWQGHLRLNNVFDKEYAGYSIYSASRGDDFVYPAAGRTLEAGVSLSF